MNEATRESTGRSRCPHHLLSTGAHPALCVQPALRLMARPPLGH